MKIPLKATVSETIILWWLFIASQFSLDFIPRAEHNDEAKWEGVARGIGAIDEALVWKYKK